MGTVCSFTTANPFRFRCQIFELITSSGSWFSLTGHPCSVKKQVGISNFNKKISPHPSTFLNKNYKLRNIFDKNSFILTYSLGVFRQKKNLTPSSFPTSLLLCCCSSGNFSKKFPAWHRKPGIQSFQQVKKVCFFHCMNRRRIFDDVSCGCICDRFGVTV